MNNWNGEERRRYPRYSINKCVQLKLQDDLGNPLIQYHGYCENISLKSIYIKMPHGYREMKKKTKLQVKIPAWGIGHYLELTGQVAWYSQEKEVGNIGIQFLSNNNKGKEVLLFQLVEDVQKKASADQNNVRIIRNADLARGKVIC